MQPEIAAALLPVVETLEALGVRYYIGGSLASSVHGVPRTTLDVDLAAELRLTHAAAFALRLRSAYYLSEEALRAALRERGAFNLIHLQTMLKVGCVRRRGGRISTVGHESGRTSPSCRPR